jgi:hypothetical protein
MQDDKNPKKPKAPVKPAIVDAKEKIASSPVLSVKKEEPVPKTISLEWGRVHGPYVKDQLKSLRDVGLVEKGPITTQDVGAAMGEKAKQEDILNRAKGTDNTQIGGVGLMSGGQQPAGTFILEGLSDVYDLANKHGIVTSQDFLTSFPSLVKGVKNPELKKFLSDPLTFQQMPNLKEVASEHYSRLKRSFDERAKSAQSQSTQAPAQSAAPATAPTAGDKLRVRKM